MLKAPVKNRNRLGSLFFFSAAVIFYETLLTRLFSVSLGYHYVFVIVSAAMLGFGFGGINLKLFKRIFRTETLQKIALIFSLSLTLVFICYLALSVIGAGSRAVFFVFVVLSFIPFCMAGAVYSYLFSDTAGSISSSYGFDLLGASAGALCVIPFADGFGVLPGCFFSAVLCSAGTILCGSEKPKKYIPFSVFILCINSALLLSVQDLQTSPVLVDRYKEMKIYLEMHQNETVTMHSAWSSFGRTDLLSIESRPDEMVMFIDGSAGTAMYNRQSVLGDSENAEKFKNQTGLYFPFRFKSGSRELSSYIIGPGGGRDVLAAILGGATGITAAEVNPDIVEFVREYEDFNGRLYTGAGKTGVVIEEGRTYLRSSGRKFDTILFSLPSIKSSRSIEGYSLTENYLYTVEAFGEYFNALNPGGRIIITAHDWFEIYRLLGTVNILYDKIFQGGRDFWKCVYAFSIGTTPTVVFSAEEFTPPEILERLLAANELGYLSGPHYFPFTQNSGGIEISAEIKKTADPVCMEIAAGRLGWDELGKEQGFNFSPVTDNSPFFYNFRSLMPDSFRYLLPFFTLLTVLIMILINLGKGLGQGRRAVSEKLTAGFLFGIGFMLFEVSFFQRMMLYIGDPMHSLTYLLFSLLIGQGAGSFCSGRVKVSFIPVIVVLVLSAVVYAVLVFFGIEAVLPGRSNPELTAVLLIVPMGFMLGFPFPLTIRLIEETETGRGDAAKNSIAVFYGVNGIGSVCGSFFAVFLAIVSGWSAAVFTGAAVYCIAAGIIAAERANIRNPHAFTLSTGKFRN